MLQNLNENKNHLVSGTGIQTNNLLDLSIFP